MSWFRIRNYADIPVHAHLTWANFNEDFVANNIPPMHPNSKGEMNPGYAEWDVGGAAAHDLNVVAANGENAFTNDNSVAITEWVVGGVGAIATVAGIVLVPFTGGLSASMTAAGAASLATIVGGTVLAADIVVTGVQIAMKPTKVTMLYAPDGYNFEVRGGKVQYRTEGEKIIVTGITPLEVHWHNNTSGTQGVERA